MENNTTLNDSWFELLHEEFNKDYMQELKQFLITRRASGATIYPPKNEVFNALNLVQPSNIKAVIIGQDPYHGEGQAHGLSFSVKDGIKLPPSLRNIYKELNSDLGITQPGSGFLEPWAKQGVLMLNAVLTVEKNSPGSHANKGWEIFTDNIIKTISQNASNVVFILWGAYAQKKAELIDSNKHMIIKSAHPSPFSAQRGFFGSRPFSKTNEYLINSSKEPINWSL